MDDFTGFGEIDENGEYIEEAEESYSSDDEE